MTSTQPPAVPRRDMTRVASRRNHPAPVLGPENTPAQATMNLALWDLIDRVLFRVNVALDHHGYDTLIREVNRGAGEVAAAWTAIVDPDHAAEMADLLEGLDGEAGSLCRHCGARLVAHVEQGGDYPGDHVSWTGPDGSPDCDPEHSNQPHEPVVTR